jgi:protein O-mannosyl-transferase
VLSLALIALYWPSLSSPLLFDDSLLESPSFLASYRELFPLKVRALSYGTFAWFSDGASVGLSSQRLLNVVIHVFNALALAWLYARLLTHVQSEYAGSEHATKTNSQLFFAICVFAFNPVAVYAVAYLVQRSILLCMGFSVLCMIATLYASERGGAQRWLLAVAAYIAALLSKEYALALPAACAAIVIIVRRPSAQRLAFMMGVVALLAALVATALYSRYGRIIGTAFDDASASFLRQLDGLAPGVRDNAWPLSILNQTVFFFEYGWRWFFPNVGAMSIDMRPPFPIGIGDAKYWVAALGYLALLCTALTLLLRYRDWRTLLGFALFVPATLFVTEFSTVWIQDPFVLYRSYLWAIGVPGVILAVAIRINMPARVWLLFSIIVAPLFSALAYDRIRSMQSAYAVWDDAAKKVPPYLTVGQSRVFNNRGQAALQLGNKNAALRDFRLSTRLGDSGEGLLNIALVAIGEGRASEAKVALAGARSRGMKSAPLAYNEGTLLALEGKLKEAVAAYDTALQSVGAAQIEAAIRAKRALALIDLGRVAESSDDLTRALALAPNDPDVLQVDGFLSLAKKDYANAVAKFDRQLTVREDALGLYGRGRAKLSAGDSKGALTDIDKAIAKDPANMALQEFRSRLSAASANDSGIAPATDKSTKRP